MFSHLPAADFSLAIRGVIQQGHGVASGHTASARYPEGTLALQTPVFRERGVDLSAYFRGTLNVDISPLRFELTNPDITLRHIAWTNQIPPEHFSFCTCLLEALGATHHALIYHPHRETKVEHFQSESLIEVLAPFVPDVGSGARVTLWVRPRQLELLTPGKPDL